MTTTRNRLRIFRHLCVLLLLGFLLHNQGQANGTPAQDLRTSAEILAQSKPSDWRQVDFENLLYLNLPQGRVTIELLPEWAPQHVARVKSLARQRYWNGLAILRAQDNYVVQWADPAANDPQNPSQKNKFKNATPRLPPEFERPIDKRLASVPVSDKDSYAPITGFYKGFATAAAPKTNKTWLVHCYGSIGVGRDDAVDSADGTELYAVIGHSPRHLDRNVTLIGRVLQGMEILSALPRGKGNMGFYTMASEHTPIHSLQLATDVAKKDQITLEVLKTEAPIFKAWVESRKNRREAWFHHPANGIEICNVPIPVRVKTN